MSRAIAYSRNFYCKLRAIVEWGGGCTQGGRPYRITISIRWENWASNKIFIHLDKKRERAKVATGANDLICWSLAPLLAIVVFHVLRMRPSWWVFKGWAVSCVCAATSAECVWQLFMVIAGLRQVHAWVCAYQSNWLNCHRFPCNKNIVIAFIPSY